MRFLTTKFFMKKIALVFLLVLISNITILAQAPVASKTLRQQSKKSLPVTAVLGAFADEVNILKAQVSGKKTITIQGIQFVQGVLNGRKVVIAQTGIGKVNAAITTTLMLDHFY